MGRPRKHPVETPEKDPKVATIEQYALLGRQMCFDARSETDLNGHEYAYRVGKAEMIFDRIIELCQVVPL